MSPWALLSQHNGPLILYMKFHKANRFFGEDDGYIICINIISLFFNRKNIILQKIYDGLEEKIRRNYVVPHSTQTFNCLKIAFMKKGFFLWSVILLWQTE